MKTEIHILGPHEVNEVCYRGRVQLASLQPVCGLFAGQTRVCAKCFQSKLHGLFQQMLSQTTTGRLQLVPKAVPW